MATVASSSSAADVAGTGDMPSLPADIFQVVADYAQIEDLLSLRSVDKSLKITVEAQLSDEEWDRRTASLPAGRGASKIRVRTRLVLACLAGPCCTLCGRKYDAKARGTDDLFGVYAHQNCRKRRLVRSELIASRLRPFIPKDKAIEINRDDIEAVAHRAENRTGYKRFGHDMYGYSVGHSSHQYQALWMLPHWATSDSLFDAATAKKENDGSAMASVLVDALEEYGVDDRKKRQAKREEAERERAAQEARVSEFREKVGPKVHERILHLRKTLPFVRHDTCMAWRKKEKESQEFIINKTVLSLNKFFSKNLDFLDSGITAFYDKKKDSFRAVGAAIDPSIWKEKVKTAGKAIRSTNKRLGTNFSDRPKKKLKWTKQS